MGWQLFIFISGCIAVSAGCLVPARWLPPLRNDKLLHFLAFGGLALLATQMARTHAEQLAWLLGLLAAGWAIEVLQNLVPGRKFCWRDMAANAAGISVAALLSFLTTRL
jgi:VanZ family protein